MMKHGNNNLSDSLAGHAFGTKGASAGTSNSMLLHERMTKKIYQFVSITKKRLERRAVSLYQLFYQYCGTHYVASSGTWFKDVVDKSDVDNMKTDEAPTKDEQERARNSSGLFCCISVLILCHTSYKLISTLFTSIDFNNHFPPPAFPLRR